MPVPTGRVLFHHQLRKGPRPRKKPARPGKSPLTVRQILEWADAFHADTGQWPKRHSGSVSRGANDTWLAVSQALGEGLRGLPGGSSLAQLLAAKRGVRNGAALPTLKVKDILAWADDHYRRTGHWPTISSGPVTGATSEMWPAVDMALRQGHRGLPGGSSLAQLLAAHRGVRNHLAQPKLSEGQILRWADAHHRRTGTWPGLHSGAIQEAPGETWGNVDCALGKGQRGLPGGSSLARLLAARRGKRNIGDLPRLTVRGILAWADAHHARTGEWPTKKSGPIPEALGETWGNVTMALAKGLRGWAAGSSLAVLLAKHRVARNRRNLPQLSTETILTWADDHHQRTGHWPGRRSGAIQAAPQETWSAVDAALSAGSRGLPGGDSLPKLLARCRGVRHIRDLPGLTAEQIRSWAQAHKQRTGRWPTRKSGPVAGAPGETWMALDQALCVGYRGLPGGSSLTQVLRPLREAETRAGSRVSGDRRVPESPCS